MKPYHVAIFALLFNFPFSAIAGDPPIPTSRNKPTVQNGDIQLSIALSKDRIHIGELTDIKLTLRNCGETPLQALLPRYTTSEIEKDVPIRLYILGEGGEKRLPISLVHCDGPYPPGETVKLVGGQETHLSYDLFDIFGMEIPAGRYDLVATYEGKEFQAESPKARFTILKMTPTEEEGAKLCQRWFMRGFREEKIEREEFRRFIRENPDVPVSMRLKILLGNILWRSGKKEEAADIWKELFEHNDILQDHIRWKLASFYKEKGNLAEAIRILEPVERIPAQNRVRSWKKQLAREKEGSNPEKNGCTSSPSSSSNEQEK